MDIKLAVIAVTLFAGRVANAAPWSLSVVDENGAPIRAQVHIRDFARDTPQYLETDDAGHVAGDMKLNGRTNLLGRVFIYAEGHAPAGGILRTGDNRAKFGAARTISGRVVDDSGKPLSNVTVQVHNLMAERSGDRRDEESASLEDSVEFFLFPRDYSLFSARTDAKGRYTLKNLPARGTASVVVNDERWQSAFARVDLLNAKEVPDIKTRPGARFSGRVLKADGTPLANTRIYAEAANEGADTETDAEGRYVLRGLKAIKYRIVVSTDPQSDSGIPPTTEATAVIGVETKVPDIRLEQGALIEVKTTPAASGGSFNLVSADAPPYQTGTFLYADEGVIRAWVRPGKYRINVQDAPQDWMASPESPAGGTKVEAAEGRVGTAEIRLVPALVLEGVARDEAGKPVAGAHIPGRYGEPDIKTDAQGRFTLHDLSPGEINLTFGSEWEVVKPGKVALPATQPVVVTLRKTILAPLRGRVVDDKGAPVENATVVAGWTVPEDASGVTRMQEKRAVTGADGRYEVMGVHAGSRVTVIASKAKHRFIGGGKVTVAGTILGVNGQSIPNPKPTFTVSDIVLQSLEREATGRVVDATGKPVADALVAALGGGVDEYGVASRNIGRTDEEGRFALSDLPAGELGFVAGTSDAFAQIKSASSTLGDLVLKPQARPAPDPALARQIVFDLIADATGNGYPREMLPLILVPYDFQAALEAARALQPDGKVKPEMLSGLVSKLIRTAPEEARRVLPGILPELEDKGAVDEGWFTSLLVDVTRLIPKPEQETVADEKQDAAMLRAWVWQGFAEARDKLTLVKPEETTDLTVAFKYLWLGNLGSRLGAEDAAQWTRAAIDIATRYDAGEPAHGGGVAAAAEALAQGRSDLLEKMLEAIPPEQRAQALGRAIPTIARNDLAGALRLLELIPLQPKPTVTRPGDADPETAFAIAAKAVILRMGAKDVDAKDAAAALALARRVTYRGLSGEVLALAARLQPKDEAAALLREAYDMATNNAYPQTRIIGIALSSDTPATAEFLAKAEEKFLAPWRYEGLIRPSAFYMAQLQPGRTRVWLEWEWAHSQNKGSGANSTINLETLALAMRAIDTKRALEMAASVPPRVHPDGTEDFSERWEAQRKVAEFLVVPEKERHSFDFNRWGAGDSWSPGDDARW